MNPNGIHGPAGLARATACAWRVRLFRLLAVALLVCPGLAQELPESRAFRSAVDAFQLGLAERAQREFHNFVAAYPQSTLLPEAILFEARAALQQTNLTEGIALLSTHLGKAGPLTDQYRYRLAGAYLQSTNYAAAADSFLFITQQLTNSPLLLEASQGEAQARFYLKEYRRVITLLQDPAGAFQRASRARPTDLFTLSGQLLLAEALLQIGDYTAAEEAARRIPENSLTPEYRWDRQYLVCRIQMADRRLEEALVQSSNLVALASATTRRTMTADSVAMQASILQQLNRLDEAIRVYSQNLADPVPPDRRRLAFLSIVELRLQMNQMDEAQEMLQTFLARHPDDAASDVVLLTSGEMHLKRYLAQPPAAVPERDSAAAGTNDLRLALAQFDRVLALTNSSLLGKALLNKGWCLWLDEKVPESASAFRAASELLPFSEELAVARFKFADALYWQGDYAAALRVYRAVTNDFASLPRVQESFMEQALYQIVRASIETGDSDGASRSIASLLNWSPGGQLSQHGLWLVGRDRMRLRRPPEARRIFADFIKRFPDRPLRPEVELAIARTYELEGDWSGALGRYEEWLNEPRNEQGPLRPRAEYCRALASYQAYGPTNAFPLFTNFVAQFSTNTDLAPRAQMWVAQEFFRQQNYVEALRQFQLIVESTNWPVTRLTWEARMMAGRSAFNAQLWKEAAGKYGHFTALINSSRCPEDLLPEAWFAFGDTTIQGDLTEQESGTFFDPLKKFAVASIAFDRIPKLYPNHRLVPLAYGKIGDCALQLASRDPKQYETATNAYWNAYQHPSADLATRCLAQFGLGRALESQASRNPSESVPLLKAALDHYVDILTAPNEGESLDPLWVERAGLAAARLAEELKMWSVAINIYERLQSVLPPLRPRLQEKISRAQEQRRLDNELRREALP